MVSFVIARWSRTSGATCGGAKAQAGGDGVLPPQHPQARPLVVAAGGGPYAQLVQDRHGAAGGLPVGGQTGEELHVLTHEQVFAVSADVVEGVGRAELIDALRATPAGAVVVPVGAQQAGAEPFGGVERRDGSADGPQVHGGRGCGDRLQG